MLKTFAKGQWEATGKRTRVVSGEKQQSEGVLREGIEAGWILPWWINDRRDSAGNIETPFERLTDAMLGHWPEDTANPFSKLVPAFGVEYRAMCRANQKHPEDVQVYRDTKAPTTTTALKCPKCQSPVIVDVVRVVTDTRLSEIGAYFMEGASEFGDIMMSNMAVRTATLQASGQNMSGAGVGGNVAIAFKDGDYVLGGNTQGHYGIAQNQLKNKIGESAHLPVEYVWWTAVIEDGKDQDRGGIMVFGPKIPGNAKTADVPRWMGTTLSTCTVPVQNGQVQQSEYRLYLREYYQDWIPMIAKQRCIVNNRIPPENLKGIPQFVKVDFDLDTLEIAGRKCKPKTLLWDITKIIEERQAPVAQVKAR